MVAVLIRIVGKVQGVSFRYHIKNTASEYHVTGWVRNRSDGAVEAFFQGNEEHVYKLVDWCQQGPEKAEVHHIDVLEANIDPLVSTFMVRPTC